MKDQPGKVTNPAHGQLNEQRKLFFPCPRSCLRNWSRETGSAVPSRVSLFFSILRLNLILLMYPRDRIDTMAGLRWSTGNDFEPWRGVTNVDHSYLIPESSPSLAYYIILAGKAVIHDTIGRVICKLSALLVAAISAFFFVDLD